MERYRPLEQFGNRVETGTAVQAELIETYLNRFGLEEFRVSAKPEMRDPRDFSDQLALAYTGMSDLPVSILTAADAYHVPEQHGI